MEIYCEIVNWITLKVAPKLL